jgi:uncharacterized protein
MSTKFIKDPHEVVKAGQVVKVKVLEVDAKRQRIALTMRLDDEFAGSSAPQQRSGGQTQDRSAGRSGVGRAQQRTSREPEPSGAIAAAFAKLKQR